MASRNTILMFVLVALAAELLLAKTANIPASFKQQMVDIIQGIKTLDTPEGRALKNRLLSQIFVLYETLDKYKTEGLTLAQVRAEVKNILKTIKDIQDRNYDQDALVAGENNSAYGSDSSAQGNSNKVSGDNSIVEGRDNRIVGDNTFSAGSQTQVIGDNTFTVGNKMNVRGDNTAAFGARGVVKGNNRLAIDKFNIDLTALNAGSNKFLTIYKN